LIERCAMLDVHKSVVTACVRPTSAVRGQTFGLVVG
jgi:hypothetical protein